MIHLAKCCLLCLQHSGSRLGLLAPDSYHTRNHHPMTRCGSIWTHSASSWEMGAAHSTKRQILDMQLVDLSSACPTSVAGRTTKVPRPGTSACFDFSRTHGRHFKGGGVERPGHSTTVRTPPKMSGTLTLRNMSDKGETSCGDPRRGSSASGVASDAFIFTDSGREV